ncbi:MAG: MBL fold metallo-hydrolase [Bacilli bacterium]|nr:MBL fold metallo-hydrolase [Bacilli bacterium]
MLEINTQSSIKIEGIYFDPFKIKEERHDAKVIFITHSHYDHFDINSIKKVKNENTIIIVPNDEEILFSLKSENVFVVEPSREYEIGNIKFKTVPSYNIEKPFHKREYGWIGYVVKLDKTYYIMGDTDLTEESKNVKCDHLFVPIGGTYTMDYKEAANLTNIIKPKIVTPIHYGSIIGDKSLSLKFKKLVDKSIEVKIIL